MELFLDILFSEVILIPLTFIGVIILVWLKMQPDPGEVPMPKARRFQARPIDDAIYGRSPGGALDAWKATGAHKAMATFGRNLWAGLHRADWSGFLDDSAPTTPMPPPKPRSTTAVQDAPLPLRDWWPVVVGRVHHLLLVGASQSGKSKLAEKLLISRAANGDEVVVIDPHATINPWQVKAVGQGRDYVNINAAFLGLELEMERRFQQGATFRPLSIFIDEFPAIADNCPDASRVMVALAQEAAKVKMRLVVLTQSPTVASLGISGKGAVRESFSRLLLGGFAIAEKQELVEVAWPAVLDYEGKQHALSRQGLLEMFAGKVPHIHVWSVEGLGEAQMPQQVEVTPTQSGDRLTADHLRVAMWLGQQPGISQAEVARRLWPGSNGQGSYNVKAAAIINEVRALLK